MSGDQTQRSTIDLSRRPHTRNAAIEITVAGDLDMAAALQLETRVDALLTAGDAQAVLLDLAQVGFIDSAGLGALLAIRERATQLEIDLSVTRLSDHVRRILDLTGLNTNG